MTGKMHLSAWVGGHLPRAISDTFTDAEAIAAWLRGLGYPYQSAVALTLPDGNQRATANGFVVCRNGYVFRGWRA